MGAKFVSPGVGMSAKILAIDTATEACSVALLYDDQVDALFEVCPREHTQRILPMVQTVLAHHHLTLQQLDALAFGRGPGSFTGVRIGIGVAQGLSLGAALPMVGVSTLAAMAERVWCETGVTQVLTAIDARMGEVYWAEYQRDGSGCWQGEDTEHVLTPEAALDRMEQLDGVWAMAGTGWEAWPALRAASSLTLIPTEVALPVAKDMLPLAAQALRQGKAQRPEEAEPVYLRNKVAWKKLPGRV